MKLYYQIFSFFLLLITGCSISADYDKPRHAEYPVAGVPFNQVRVTDNFWLPKIETNRIATIPISFAKCEEMGRMDNFLIAGGEMEGKVKGGMPFDDTDLYKIIEGASYSMTTIPDPILDAYTDSVIAIIAKGQEADGYLTTYKTIDPTYSPAEWCPPGDRWEGLEKSHELYNSGHLFEAAAAHYYATGKRNLLDIAIKNADLLVTVFGAGKNEDVPGHQIVETGLIKLYLITNKKEYLHLARFFLDNRGHATNRKLGGTYNQDHKPVLQQDEAVGHAVRAAYMYAGMTDVAALYDDEAYKNAVGKIWDNTVSKKMYITGGIGAIHNGEAFGENYELPNLTAYNETCASIANVYWNYRMFLLHGHSKYIDVLERSLYNGVIAGVALDGKHFFYPNPLQCDMQYRFNTGKSLVREPWFDCSCCPTNLCRFMPSVPGYIYAQQNSNLYVNLFVESNTAIEIDGILVEVAQKTEYPWHGDVAISINPKEKKAFTLKVRVPGWSVDKPVPSDLYTYATALNKRPTISINGASVNYTVENGYATLHREWSEGDNVAVSLPMEVRRVKANDLVEADRGKVALERGPIVYCVEEVDNSGIDRISVSQKTIFASQFHPNLLSGIEVVTASGDSKEEIFTAVPYFVWNNRGANKMNVWLDESN